MIKVITKNVITFNLALETERLCREYPVKDIKFVDKNDMTDIILVCEYLEPEEEEEEEEQNKLIEGVPLEIHEALLTVRQAAMRHGFYTRGIRLEQYRRDSVCGGGPEYLALPERLYGIAIDVKRS